MEDNQRQAMHEASHQNQFGSYKTIENKIYVPPTFEEFKAKLVDKSPVFIYNIEWSRTEPLYEIKGLIYPNSAIQVVCNSLIGKSPKLTSITDFYQQLKNTIESIRF